MSFNLKHQHLILLLALTGTVLSFQNCSKTGLSVTDEPSMKLMGIESLPLPQDDHNVIEPGEQVIVDPSEVKTPDDVAKDEDSQQSTDDYSQALTGVCAIFKDVQLPIPLASATEDYILKNHAGSLTIGPSKNVSIQYSSGDITIESALNVDISDTAGLITVKSAQSAKIQRGAGSVKVAANEITAISGRAGALCLNAVKIGKLNDLAGGTKVIAEEIEEIANFAGDVHIYGARVNRISNGAGNICLHDGATVVSFGGVAGRIGECK